MKRTFYNSYRFLCLFCVLLAGGNLSYAQLIATYAGNGTTSNPYTGDGGAATAAQFNSSWGVASDGMGNIYITDVAAGRVRKINSAGVISWFAGTINSGTASGDGGPATAAVIRSPYGIAADGAGNVYICDYGNELVRKVNSVGIISTFAGGGSATTEGIQATNTKLINPQNICVDAAGNVYIICNGQYRIRKVTPSGIINTIAGNGIVGVSADGTLATAGSISGGLGVTTDAAGNVYFCDQQKLVRKINSAGVLSTVAGDGTLGYSGDGGQATAADLRAYSVVSDAIGTLYISDATGRYVRKVSTSGIITTYAGNGSAIYGGENVPATATGFNFPTDVALDGQNNLYIMDWFGYRLSKTPGANVPPYFTGGHSQTASLCSGSLSLNALLAANDVNIGQAETWSIVSGPTHGTATVAYSTTSTGGVMTPTGLSYTPTSGYTGTDVISVSVIDTGGIADTTTITITVGAVVSAGVITGPSAVCLGSTITLADAVTGGVWSAGSNVTISSTGVVTGVTVGTAAISYSVTGSCGTSVAKGTVTVVDMPGPVNGPANVCTGATIVLTDAVAGGFWKSDDGTIATASPTGGVVFGVKAGTVIISYTIGGVCAATSTITVEPPLPAIKGPGKVCVGQTVTLSDSVTSGTWSEPSGFVSVNPTTGDVYGLINGTGTITYSVSSGCIAVKAFTVNPNPSTIMLTSAVMCYSDKGMYATDADAGGIWTSALVTIATGGYITAYASGSGLITYTLPTGCITTTPITVNPLPAMITGPKGVCTGDLTALADATGGGTWSTTDANVLIDIYSGALYGSGPAGTAVITYQLPTSCFVVDTISVFQSPTAILGVPNVCIGNITNLSNTVAGGSWSITPGSVASVSPLGAVLGITAGAATVSYTTGTGCSATQAVTVWALPSQFTVTGGGSYCLGGAGVSVALTGSVPGVRYYLFNGSTLIDSLMGTGGFLNYGLRKLPGIYTVYATNLATLCGNGMTGSAIVNIDPVVAPVVTITTAPGDKVCEGGSITFAAGSGFGGTSPSYQWKVNGKPAGTGTNTYTYVPVDGDVVGIELTSNATCAAPLTAYAFRTISVVTPVVPVLVLSADPGISVLEGTTVTYTATITNKVEAPSYQWIKNGIPVLTATSSVFVDESVHNFDTISCLVFSGGFCSQPAIERLHINVYKDNGGNLAVHTASGTDATIRVVPNPSKGAFVVTGTMTEEHVTLELTDMIGRTIYKGEATTTDGKLNTEVRLTNTVANGTYLLNVRSGDMNKVFHIIIEQ